MKKFASFLAVFLLITLCAAASESGDRDIPAEVAQLTDSLKKQFAPDKRVALLEIDYSFSGKNVMLRGVTTSAEAKTVLLIAGYRLDNIASISRFRTKWNMYK